MAGQLCTIFCLARSDRALVETAPKLGVHLRWGKLISSGRPLTRQRCCSQTRVVTPGQIQPQEPASEGSPASVILYPHLVACSPLETSQPGCYRRSGEWETVTSSQLRVCVVHADRLKWLAGPRRRRFSPRQKQGRHQQAHPAGAAGIPTLWQIAQPQRQQGPGTFSCYLDVLLRRLLSSRSSLVPVLPHPSSLWETSKYRRNASILVCSISHLPYYTLTSYFGLPPDSGDYALAKAGKQKEYGKEIPTPDAIPHASPSPMVVGSQGSAGSASGSPPAGTPLSGLGSPPVAGAIPLQSGSSSSASAAAEAEAGINLSMSPGRVGVGGQANNPALATSPTRSFGSFPIAHSHAHNTGHSTTPSNLGSRLETDAGGASTSAQGGSLHTNNPMLAGTTGNQIGKTQIRRTSQSEGNVGGTGASFPLTSH